MTDSTPASAAVPSASGQQPYSDTQAVDDVQALLTNPGRPRGEDAVDEVTEIVRRTGRSAAIPRIMVVQQGTGRNGLPCTFISAEGTAIRISQDPDTGALRVGIPIMNSLDEQHLEIEVGGQQLLPAPGDAEDADAGDGEGSETEGGAS